MPVLSRAAATTAAELPAFHARVRSTIVAVAVDVHGGPATYTQAQYNARAALASAVCKEPSGYAEVFAAVVAAHEWTPGGGAAHCVPGAGDGTDPLIANANGDAALRAGVEYSWDTVAATPKTV